MTGHPVRRAAGLALIALPALAGCRVDPTPDYQRVKDQAARATGEQTIYRPEDDAAIPATVHELLKDGLTLAEAVQIALINNRDFQAAWMDVGMAKADLVQAKLLSNPSLDFSMRFPAAGGLPDIDATLAHNIADLWQIAPRKRAAGHALDQAILSLARKATELAADAKNAYYRAAAAQQALEIAEENRRIAQQLLDFALVRQKAGAGTEVDVNLSRGPVLDAELAIKAARLEAGDARRDLFKVLSLKDDADAVQLVDALPAPPDEPLNVEALVDLAHDERLDFQAAEQAVESAQSRVQQQYAAIFPNVTLGAETERNARKHQLGRKVLADTARTSIANGALTAPTIQPRSERRRNRNIAHNDIITGPSLSMTLPVFDQNQAQIAKALYGLTQLRKVYESMDLSLTQDVRSAAAQAQTAWDVARFYHDQSMPLAQRNIELTRDMYRAGKATLLEVLQLQEFLLETRNRYVKAMQESAMRIAELERVVGLPMDRIRSAQKDEQPPASTPGSTGA